MPQTSANLGTYLGQIVDTSTYQIDEYFIDFPSAIEGVEQEWALPIFVKANEENGTNIALSPYDSATPANTPLENFFGVIAKAGANYMKKPLGSGDYVILRWGRIRVAKKDGITIRAGEPVFIDVDVDKVVFTNVTSGTAKQLTGTWLESGSVDGNSYALEIASPANINTKTKI